MATQVKIGSNITDSLRSPVSRIPIITYHSIDDSGSVISTARSIFERQMGHLSYAGYNAISLSELVELLRYGSQLPSKTVVLTFDDGFLNFYEAAFPILNKYKFNATVFIVTDFCGKYNDWAGNPEGFPHSRLLSWKDISELDALGIEFGSHTQRHTDLTRLTEEAINEELIGSKKTIEDKLGREAKTFAYPFGLSNRIARRLVEANFEAACSTDLGKVNVRSDVFQLNRIDSYYLANQRLFEIIPSATFDNYMRIRQAMRTVRTLLSADSFR